jgi:hypothetical protein
MDSCGDAGVGKKDETSISSFGAAVRYFRPRANRLTPRDDIDLFERFFIGLYEPEGERKGDTMFFDVTKPPPRNRAPHLAEVSSFEEFVKQIGLTYDLRNDPPFQWAE